jgi:hypothetical protein
VRTKFYQLDRLSHALLADELQQQFGSSYRSGQADLDELRWMKMIYLKNGAIGVFNE